VYVCGNEVTRIARHWNNTPILLLEVLLLGRIRSSFPRPFKSFPNRRFNEGKILNMQRDDVLKQQGS
jgi:hypothetical protein